MKKYNDTLCHNCGNKIAELRKSYKLSQAELAEKLNISKSTLGHYEQGVSLPPSQLLVSISKFFKVPVDYLLGISTCEKEYSKLSDKFSDSVTFADMINRIENLNFKNRKALVYLISIMEDSQTKK